MNSIICRKIIRLNTLLKNGLSGIPQDVLNKLPQSFFGNEEIEHGDALREFMIKHKASMQNSSNDGINMHPNEYFKKVVMKEKND